MVGILGDNMAFKEQLTVKANGIYSYQDQLSEVPEGSLSEASNIVINKDGLFSPRRGYRNLDSSLQGAIKSMHTYTVNRFNHLLAYSEYDGSKDLSAYDDDTGTWSTFPTSITPPEGANTIKTAQANKNLFLTSSNGVQKLDAINGDILDAGAPEGLDIEAVATNLGGGGALPIQPLGNAQAVAYRTVWGYRDANNNLVLGPPSQRVVHSIRGDVVLDVTSVTAFTVTVSDIANVQVGYIFNDGINSSVITAVDTGTKIITVADDPGWTTGAAAAETGPSDVSLTITIPAPPVDDSWFVQVYRTAVLDGITPTEVGDPGDDMGLVLERNPLPADISNQEMTIVDVTPDTLRGADLYTNATQQGPLQANYAPPQCLDLALYQNHMFYANTQSKYQVEMALLAVDGKAVPTNSTALQKDDTVTIDGVVYTARRLADGGEDPSTNHFLVGDGPSLSDNIEDTAKSLIKVINKSASNSTIWAVYDSGETDVPGLIRLYERDFGDAAAFQFDSSRAGAWSPDLATGPQESDNEVKPNRLYYSKFQQPESVPLLQFFDVGAANDEILRILPLRSILLIFTSAGIYKLTGATANSFQISLLDDTAVLEAPDSLVALNNNAVGFFDQGVCQVSYGSVSILSRPIEGDLNQIRGAAGDKLGELTFGISYETDRKYMIGLPTGDADTEAQIIYVYNVFTQSWTTYDLAFRNGIIRNEDDKVYLCKTDTIIQERKDYSDLDFAEPEIDVEATAVAGVSITLDSTAGIKVGYLYLEDTSNYSIITGVDQTTNTITVLDDLEWNVGTAEVRPYIQTSIEWNPITADTPNILKQWSEATLLVNKPITSADVSFKTLTSGFYETVNFNDTSNGPWGLFEWGDVPWGGTGTLFRYRTWVPREKQRDSAIILKVEQDTINNDFEISGWSLIYRDISQRVTR